MTPNQKAFLHMIAVSEGTERIGDHGYNALVGGGTFHDYSRHPAIRVALPRKGLPPLYSTAAGRYQFLVGTWDNLARALKLTDFTPASQDLACLQLVRECAALLDIEAGNIRGAIQKCAHIWASLPGAGYGQHENAVSTLIAAYCAAGGVVA
jgi:muramidase (phage lysozyme)